MASYYIIFIDYETHSCPEDKVEDLPIMIQNSIPQGELQLQRHTRLPVEPLTFQPDLILLRPPSMKSLQETIPFLKKKWSQVPILGLFCKRLGTPYEILKSLHNGLDDFVSCPFKEVDLIPRVQRFLQKESRPHISLKPKAVKELLHMESLIGESECFLREVEKIPRMANSDSTVLILGETGTGKELFARAIHYHSARRVKPFVPINCGALPDHLFENELFGHAKGAFTDASSEERGLLAEAEGGTLFLDEIDSLSPSAQVKLLRFLQDREYRPLGSSKSRVADVRILAATNADLKELVQSKRFREDLFYRLNILSLFLPPLRERVSDIPILANRFVSTYGIEFHKKVFHLSPCALRKLLAYHWPGNVRELEGVIQRSVVLSSFPVLRQEDIQLSVDYLEEISKGESYRDVKIRTIFQFERTYLSDLLVKHQGNITRAAETAGMKRQALQRLLRKYGLIRTTFEKST